MTDINQSSQNEAPRTTAASAIANDVTQQVSGFASEALDRVKDLGAQASASASGFKDRAAGLKDSAASMAASSSDKLLSAMEGQKAAGADRISGFAAAMRRAADELDKELPPAASLVREAADQVDAASDAVRNRDFKQLAGTVQDFARRQPAAFLGISVLAGFAAVRLLKTPVATTDTTGNASGFAAPSGGSRS